MEVAHLITDVLQGVVFILLGLICGLVVVVRVVGTGGSELVGPESVGGGGMGVLEFLSAVVETL